jgi:hypothetical protein
VIKNNLKVKKSLTNPLFTAFTHPNTTITRVHQEAQKMLESQKDMQQSSGSAILDTYLQFITENTFGKRNPKVTTRTMDLTQNIFSGMGMSQEQAAAAIHAAKVAQKMALERNFDKLPQGFFPPHLDISKITNQDSGSKNLHLPNVTIEPTLNNSGHKSLNLSNSGLDIRRSHSSDIDEPHHQMSNNNNNNSINNYNKEESSADERISDDESIAVN